MTALKMSALALALAALTGCATVTGGATDATPAALPVPATLATSATAGSAQWSADTALAWRELIVDERLRALTELALANNRDLRVAVKNIDAARAQYRITDAARGPTLNASAGGTASRSSGDVNGGQASTSRQLSASLGVASWELDLWGRLGSLKDAALANYLATEATQRSVQATLVAELAEAWLTFAADEQRRALAEQTYASRRDTLTLTAKRKALGAASQLDLATTQAAAETARGDLASAQAQVQQDLNALRLLVGAEPPTALLPGADEPATAAALVAVPEGLSSTVLLRRPDVQAAELTLQAAQADVAAARAAMFPTISLTASAGTASRSLGGLFSAGSGTWSFAPSISLPIFDGGSSQAGWDQAKAQREAQLATYEKTVQSAFREVADALAVRASLQERLAAQRAQVAAYDTTLRLTTQQQRVGAESSLAVLDAQRSLWTAQQSLISLKLTEQTNRLTLFKALGGA